MNSFTCNQTTPTTIHYRGSKTFKDGTSKVSEGDVRVTRLRYFDERSLKEFAESAVYNDLNPQNDAGPANSTWKGKHMGRIHGKPSCNRSQRKTHAERRSQIVARSIAQNKA